MMSIPANPKIYHIVHIDNLSSIVAGGRLLPDSIMTQRRGGTVIGMGNIKQRRLTLPVHCHAGTFVGDYVPFYLCPRSIMLYLIYRANHPDLAYREGQTPIVHIEADLHKTIEWANANNKKWAFSLSNAGANYSQFRTGIENLSELKWELIGARDFRPPEVKESKQSEFLLHRMFPWQLVERIGYLDSSLFHPSGVLAKITDALKGAAHRPVVEKCNDWYY
jgi:ssDNA thymidine ADP-ribosyltransferase, DarT